MDDSTRLQVAAALGRIPSGCAILTAGSGTDRTGMLASWVQQAGFDPLSVSVAVGKGRPIVDLIESTGGFVLNILGEDATAMFKHFGKGFAPGEEAFAGLGVRQVGEGVIIDDRVAWLSATVRGRLDSGDHWLYVGEVTDGQGDVGAKPLVHIRKNGLGY